MTPRERVLNRLEGKPVDKIPNFNIVMQFAAKLIDVPYSEYCSNYEKLVEGNIKTCEEFGIDLMSVISDPMREAGGFGAEVVMPYDDVPYAKQPLIQTYSDIAKMRVDTDITDKRMIDRIKAVEMFKREVADEYPICGWIEAPLAEASDIRGINDLMVDLMVEKEYTRELLEKCVENGINFAKAQIEAGADIIGVGDSVASLVGPGIYEEIVLEYEERLLKEIREMGAYTKLHICGNTQSILSLLPKEYISIFDADWMVDIKTSIDVLGGTVCVNGNYDPVGVLLQGDVSYVESEVLKCVNAGNKRTIIAAGCEVPKFTPYENMKKVDEVLKSIQ